MTRWELSSRLGAHMRRVIGVAALIAGAAVVALVLGRRGTAERPVTAPLPVPAVMRPVPDAVAVDAGRPSAAVPTVAVPALPSRNLAESNSAELRVPSAGPPFEEEVRDPSWADEHEREIGLRLRRILAELSERAVRVDIDRVECRRTLCRVSVHAQNEARLGSLYGQLETPDGFAGWADAVLLAPVETAADGQVTTHVIASFERE